jgi:hypothetical protein
MVTPAPDISVNGQAPEDAAARGWNSAAISDDCRSLYAVRYVADTGAGKSSWTLEVLTR